MGWVENGAEKVTRDGAAREVVAAVLFHGILIPLSLAGYVVTELVCAGLETLVHKDPILGFFLIVFKWVGYGLLALVAWFLSISLIDIGILVIKNFVKRVRS